MFWLKNILNGADRTRFFATVAIPDRDAKMPASDDDDRDSRHEKSKCCGENRIKSLI
jgi:hypothetical protein